jgi:hypothetical protein
MASRREQMQEHIESPEWTESGPENVFTFHKGPLAAERRDSPADRDDGSAALQLVHQLADAVRSREDHAAEVEARAHALGKHALDELNLAEGRLRATEAAECWRGGSQQSERDAPGIRGSVESHRGTDRRC